ncbi:peptidoglycan/LPS O-acetylase OafA/YrhL [Pedobacter sp. CG_S7]|uniref:acyltransferase family protein n=1 Tax=Pedobacter sp. CG_S7 TaxID=3143930 RepID=UPI003394A597
MAQKKRTERIEILDGMRVLAIFMVMLFHYYSAFGASYYQYAFKPPQLFNEGYLGVQLFFVISGFVITLTLTKCSSFVEFMKKRFLRLIPAMLICSLLTFSLLRLVDSNNLFPVSKSFANLLISNTFIPPALPNTFFGVKLAYIDGAYWSLACELQFYLLAGLFYFFSPKSFLRNYAVFAILSAVLYAIINAAMGYDFFSPLIGTKVFLEIRTLSTDFLVFHHHLWFLMGIVINKLYFQKYNQPLLLLLLAIVVLQIVFLKTLYPILFTLLVLLLFLLFLYKPQLLAFLANKVLVKVGIASYSIYLIHQYVGVVVINRLSPYFGSWNFVIPMLLMLGLSFFGVMSYKYLEYPLGKQLHKLVFKQMAKVPVGVEV